jgi:hypothetical protein
MAGSARRAARRLAADAAAKKAAGISPRWWPPSCAPDQPVLPKIPAGPSRPQADRLGTQHRHDAGDLLDHVWRRRVWAGPLDPSRALACVRPAWFCASLWRPDMSSSVGPDGPDRSPPILRSNPNNTVRGNAAAGSDGYGFWYRLLDNPEGPSRTTAVCPKVRRAAPAPPAPLAATRTALEAFVCCVACDAGRGRPPCARPPLTTPRRPPPSSSSRPWGSSPATWRTPTCSTA